MKIRALIAIALFMILGLTLIASPASAQDYQATADAAEQEAQSARWRAQSAQATAEAAHVMATEQAYATATTQAMQATATAAHATSQVMATENAVQATSRALSVRATEQSLDTMATREAIAATATVGAYEAQATIQALAISRDQDRGQFQDNVYFLLLALIAAVGFDILWILAGRARPINAPTQAETADRAVVIDADPTAGNGKVRPVALIPPESGWVPAYLRPIEAHERRADPA